MAQWRVSHSQKVFFAALLVIGVALLAQCAAAVEKDIMPDGDPGVPDNVPSQHVRGGNEKEVEEEEVEEEADDDDVGHGGSKGDGKGTDNKAGAVNPEDDSDNWNPNIDWVPWPNAISLATELDKPIFLLIHKAWCPACKQTRRHIVKSVEIDALSTNFVMVHVDDEEPDDEQYAPQGSYYPRLFFLRPDGTVTQVFNTYGDRSHLHHYLNAPQIVQGMLAALRTVSGIHDVDEL